MRRKFPRWFRQGAIFDGVGRSSCKASPIACAAAGVREMLGPAHQAAKPRSNRRAQADLEECSERHANPALREKQFWHRYRPQYIGKLSLNSAMEEVELVVCLAIDWITVQKVFRTMRQLMHEEALMLLGLFALRYVESRADGPNCFAVAVLALEERARSHVEPLNAPDWMDNPELDVIVPVASGVVSDGHAFDDRSPILWMETIKPRIH